MGVYAPATSTMRLTLGLSSTAGEETFTFGGADDRPCLGDWDGDGTWGVGVRRSTDGNFYLRNARATAGADVVVSFGLPSDVGVCGDWNGDGRTDVGVYRGTERRFFLTTSLDAPNDFAREVDISASVASGTPVEPVAGDWDGDGDDDVGLASLDGAGTIVFRLFTVDGTTAMPHATARITDASPEAGSLKVVAGDWDADGRAGIGVWDPGAATFWLRNAASDGPSDFSFAFGPPGEGHWPFAYVR